jgi:glycosyltransferase involved in cell wall biosynthesis
MEKMYPKVLVIGYFNQRKPVGITTKNLFCNWPEENLAVASFDEFESMYTPGINKYYSIGNKEVKYRFPFNYFKQVHASKEIDYNSFGKIEKYKKPNNLKYCFVKTVISNSLDYIVMSTGYNIIKYKYSLSPEFITWVINFKPDIIYCTIEDIGRIQFVRELKTKMNFILAIHIMDDWINSIHSYTIIPSFWARKLKLEFIKLLNVTDLYLAISGKMAEEYNLKYGKTFYTFHNPIDLSTWNTNINRNRNDSFLFIYTGKIGKDHYRPILELISCIEKIDLQKKIEFKIYSTSDYKIVYKYLGKKTSKYFYGSVSYEEIPDILKNADGLFLPLSFQKKSLQYTRLSMPTKVTEYMASKTPILCYAPRNTAVSKYLTENNCAFVINNTSDLFDGVSQFVKNENIRKELSKNSFNIVTKNHDMNKITENLKKIFLESLSVNKN